MIRRSWMTGASIETTLERWASSLRDVKGRMRPLFTQERVAASAGSFLDGLLGAERRKTGWMRAEAAGDLGPWRQQAILGRGRWDADALRDIVRDYALQTLADPDAVLVLDETAFLNHSKASTRVGGLGDRKGPAAGRKSFGAWGAGHPPVPIMGQRTADRRDGVRNRARARPFVMEPPIGWRRNQRRKTARLGLLRTGRSRRGRI